MSALTQWVHVFTTKLDVVSLKLGTFIGLLIAAPIESKVWAGVGYIIGVVTTWMLRKRKS
jgi:hypothetical protein